MTAGFIPSFRLLFVLLSSWLIVTTSSRSIDRRGSRTSPPSGALVVRQSGTGSGEYSTISAAVAALGSGSSSKTIFIYPGTYKEQVYITYKGPLTIQGYTTSAASYSHNQVTITASATIKSAGSDDASGTLRVHKDNFSLYNVNVANSYGNAASHIQAIALSAYGSQQGYYGCQISGYQDTLLAQTGTQVYAGSLISGAVDFIFGQYGVAWFQNSVIQSVGKGCVTASGRASSDNPSYYVFNKCTLSSTTSDAAYLGRPWGDYARVMFQQCSLGSHIQPAGWSVWQSSDQRIDHVSFEEYDNSGAGASTSKRASFSSQAKSALSISSVLGSTSWVDSSYL